MDPITYWLRVITLALVCYFIGFFFGRKSVQADCEDMNKGGNT